MKKFKKKVPVIRARKWDQLRIEFINGNVTLKELAEREGVSYSRISQAAHVGKWTTQKDELIKKIMKETYDSSVESRKKQIVKFNEDCLKFAYSILGLTSKILRDEERKVVPSSTKLSRIVKTIKEAQYIGRLALNMSTEHIVQIQETRQPEEIKSSMTPNEAANLYIEMLNNNGSPSN